MSKNSSIAWTTHTFNPWWGCVKVSPGCRECYADTWAKRTGFDVWGPNAPRRFFGDKHWKEPFKWNSEAEANQKQAQVFCASMADVFEVHKNPEINRMMSNARSTLFFSIIPQTPWLDWLILTKRPENIFSLGTDAAGRIFDLYLADNPNVWLGVSVENQEQAEKRIPELVKISASIRFLSVEPILEVIDLHKWLLPVETVSWGPGEDDWGYDVGQPEIDWVIVGGESGPNHRPFEWDWARNIREQCKDADVPFFMKQGGGYPNKRESLSDIPEDLRIREFPGGETNAS